MVVTAEGYPGRAWRGRVEEVGEAVTPRRLGTQDPRRASDTRIIPVSVALLDRLPLKLGTTVQLEISAARR